MPIVPEQRIPGRQVRPPQAQLPSVGPDFGTAPARALTQGAQQIITVLQRQAEERDEAQARDAFNTFRREARNQINNLQARRGKDAYGAQSDYDQWHSENAGAVRSSLVNERQRQLFNQLAASRFESDANAIGAHVITEHFRYKESVYQDTFSSEVAEVANDPFNGKVLSAAIENVKGALDAARPGIDNGAEFDRARAEIVLAAVQIQVGQNPIKAAATVGQYKDELGGAYQKVKDQVDSESLVVIARAKHPGNFDAQYDMIQESSAVESVKTAALGRVNSAQAEFEHRADKAKQERKRNEMDGIFSALIEGDYSSARALANTLSPEVFTQQEKFGLISATQSKTFQTDPISEQGLQLDIKRGKISTPQQLLSDPRLSSISAGSMRPLFTQLEDTSGTSAAKAEANRVGHAILIIEQKYDRIFSDTDMFVMKPEFAANLNEEIKAAEEGKGRPLSSAEVTKIGTDLLRLRVDEAPFWKFWADDREFRRIQQILDPEKFPPTLEETDPPPPREETRSPGGRTKRPGVRSASAVTSQRGVPLPSREEIFSKTEGLSQDEEAVKLSDPSVKWVNAIPGDMRNSIAVALDNAGRKPYYRDIWAVYSARFPDEAKQIEQAGGL